MDKTAFNKWAANEMLSYETAERTWQIATSKVAFPSLHLVEAAMAFVIAEAVDIATMPDSDLLIVTYPTCQSANVFKSDAELLRAVADIAFGDTDFSQIHAILHNGSIIDVVREGDLVTYTTVDGFGEFKLTLRDMRANVATT